METLLGPDGMDVEFRLFEEAQMARVNSWWSVACDGMSTKGSGTHFGDKIRLLLQVIDSGKRPWNSRELDGARRKEG